MVAVPSATPVILPVASTVATALSEDVQFRVLVVAVPSPSFCVAVSVSLAPAAILIEVLLNVNEATAGAKCAPLSSVVSVVPVISVEASLAL